MRKFVNRLIIFGLIFGSMAAVALAKPIKKQVTFAEAVKVNGVLVKSGTYDVAFDEETGQLTIFKGKRTVAKAAAGLEKLNKNSRVVYALWSPDESNTEPKVLTSITLRDGNQAKLVNAGDAKAEASP
jgi:hypothetical protein